MRALTTLIASVSLGCGSIVPTEKADAAAAVVTPLTFVHDASSQRSTSQLKWSKHAASTLVSSDVTLAVCKDHFPAGSEARAEIEAAIALYNAVVGSTAHITVTEAPHLDETGLFQPSPTVSRIDYLDTLREEYPGFPCHPDKTDITRESWVMNTCRYRTNSGWSNHSGKATAFVISVNRNGYDHFSNPTSTDHPHVTGLAHELGHGFGMEHTTVWPDADRDLISTMQGNLSVLAAYDVAFMRHFYPADGTSSHVLASPRIRIKDGDKYQACYAADASEQASFPQQLYREGDTWKDCATAAAPKLLFAWFSDGTEPLTDVRGSFMIGDSRMLLTWTSPDMEGASQDTFAETLTFAGKAFEGQPMETNLTGVVSVSATAGDAKPSSSLTVTIQLHASVQGCGGASKNSCSAVLLDP